MKKKILLTGGTGLIGKETLPFLLEEGFEVFAISSKKQKHAAKINWIECDLFNSEEVKKLFEIIKPDYLLHFAWITGGDYLTNGKNILFKESGIKMLKHFKENGGQRAVYAGTCFEYDLTGNVLSEESALNPKTLYAESKHELHQFCEKYSQDNELSFAWGRIFYVYGHNEHPSRITPNIINSLLNNEVFKINAPNNKLDYMYSKDIARAFVKLLETDYNGSINICTGKGIKLSEYALTIQKLMHKSNLIEFDPKDKAKLCVIGNNKVLSEKTGFKCKYTLEEGLKEILSSKLPLTMQKSLF